MIRKPPEKKVAIVVPHSARTELSPDEEISLRHLRKHLGHYDKYLILPEGVDFGLEGFQLKRFARKFFGSAAAHNQLMMWQNYYRSFLAYEYIFIYHLDALALSDELEYWCERDFDYIGAPWIPCSEMPWVKEPRVGNGGFALMKIQSVLNVLARRHRSKPWTYLFDILTRNSERLRPLRQAMERLQKVVPNSRVNNRLLLQWQMMERPELHGCNNDFFWSFEAPKILPEFRVASVEDGLRFAFEAAPRTCFEINQRRLPFGCHAWPKFDRSFWEPHLLHAGSSMARK